MASGLACVSTNTAGGQSLLDHGVNGLLVPRRSVPALVKALNQLSNAETRLRLGAAARHTASRYTWRREAEQTLAWYQQHLRRPACSVSAHRG
jgi:glycosyltransferase involved in cell wall biosynthesis